MRGMPGMPRHGRTALGWLVRGRREGGTPGRERRMTAQCVTNRMRAAPEAVRAVPGDSVEVVFSTACRRAGAVCARAGAGPVLPVDREFFTAGVLGRPRGTGVRRAMLRPNRPRVAKPLREHAARRRRRVSEPGIPRRPREGGSVHHGRREKAQAGGREPGGGARRACGRRPAAWRRVTVPAQAGDRDRLQAAKADAHAHARPRRERQDILLCGVAHGAQRAGHAELGQDGGRRRPPRPGGVAQDAHHAGGVRRSRSPAAAWAAEEAAALGDHRVATFGICGDGPRPLGRPRATCAVARPCMGGGQVRRI